MRFFDWAVGTFVFYGIGVAIWSFIVWDFVLPLSTAGDRAWLITCGLGAMGMMLDEGRRK